MRFFFLLIPFTISMGFHSFIIYRLSNLLEFQTRWYHWAAAILLTLNIFVVFGLTLSGVWNEIIRVWLVISQIYFGSLFFSFWVFLIHFLLTLGVPPLKNLSTTIHVVLLFSTIGLCLVFGIYNAQQFKVKEIPLFSPKIAQEVVLVQITDLHLGSIYRENYIQKIVNTVNRLSPSWVLLTGDVFDHGIQPGQLAILNGIKAPIYFVWGNHEVYFGKQHARQMLSHTKIQILENQKINLLPWLELAGLDYLEHRADLSPSTALKALDLQENVFSVLLSHVPLEFNILAPFHVDLAISGHTHAGQIWPFNWFVRMKHPHVRGLNQKNGQSVYVSPGTGTWGPPMRLGSFNEITLIRLQNGP